MANDDTVEKTAKEKDSDIVALAQKCLEKYQDRESDNINRAEEAIRFRAGEQWPDAIRRDREEETQDGGSRPCPVLDKTDQYVRQIVNEERLNRAAIKIRPVDSGADPKTAEIFTGIIRHIEDASEALVAYTTAGEHAIDGGFGYFRLLTQYENDLSFDQEIKIKRVHNRFSVATGAHSESDGSDMRECLIWEDMLRTDFKREYPDAKEIDFQSTTDTNDNWADEDTIRVGEYYCIKPKKVTIHRLDTGEVFSDEDYQKIKAEAETQGIEVPIPTDTREAILSDVKWYKLTSEEVLEKSDIPGKYIPIIKVTGNEITMPDGKIRLSGAIESAMDAQRLHNYAHAGFIEHVALAPRAPWIAEASQVENYENDYADANRKPITLLKYDATSDEEGHPIPPPQRTPPAGMPTGWQQAMNNTEHGVEAAFGMYGASVGATGQEKSGIALQEQKEQGAIGQYHFPDNLARSIQHCGRILIDWIPVYYDAANVARILGEDGEQEIVNLDPDQEQSMTEPQDEMGKSLGQVYNLQVGRYDVTVSTGASYTSKRHEAVETQTQMVQAVPELMPVIGDILFSNMDAPGADKIAERLKTMLPPEIKQLEESQDVDPQTQAQMAIIEQKAQELEERGQQLMQFEQEVNNLAQTTEAEKTAADNAKKELESAKKLFMTEVKLEEANMALYAEKLKGEIEGAIGDDSKPEQTKIEIEEMKIVAADKRHNREMCLKEHDSKMSEQPREDAIKEALSTLAGQVQSISEFSAKAKPLSIERDENENILSVNGRKAKLSETGAFMGLEE